VVRRHGGDLKEVAQPLPLPQGVSDLAVGGSVPTTPEPETWLLICVVASVLGAVALRRVLP
jgi:Ca-activated chloride channel family protein